MTEHEGNKVNMHKDRNFTHIFLKRTKLPLKYTKMPQVGWGFGVD